VEEIQSGLGGCTEIGVQMCGERIEELCVRIVGAKKARIYIMQEEERGFVAVHTPSSLTSPVSPSSSPPPLFSTLPIR